MALVKIGKSYRPSAPILRFISIMRLRTKRRCRGKVIRGLMTAVEALWSLCGRFRPATRSLVKDVRNGASASCCERLTTNRVAKYAWPKMEEVAIPTR